MLPQERTRCGRVHAWRSKCTTRSALDSLLTTLIGASVGLLVDERIETEFAIASGTLVRQVTALYQSTIIGAPKPAFTLPFATRQWGSRRLADPRASAGFSVSSAKMVRRPVDLSSTTGVNGHRFGRQK